MSDTEVSIPTIIAKRIVLENRKNAQIEVTQKYIAKLKNRLEKIKTSGIFEVYLVPVEVTNFLKEVELAEKSNFSSRSTDDIVEMEKTAKRLTGEVKDTFWKTKVIQKILTNAVNEYNQSHLVNSFSATISMGCVHFKKDADKVSVLKNLGHANGPLSRFESDVIEAGYKPVYEAELGSTGCVLKITLE